MTKWRLGWICLLWALTAGPARAAQVDTTLRQLQDDGDWGEVTLADGRTRQVRVDSLAADSVAVCEIVGALQERSTVYATADIRAARVLGVYRIPQRLAPYRPPRSTAAALGLELIIPGAGYFYAGDARQGWSLLGMSALAAATAVATGKDGLAGWMPMAAWIKVASLAQLRDQVRADNGAYHDRAEDLAAHGDAGDAVVPLFGARLRF